MEYCKGRSNISELRKTMVRGTYYVVRAANAFMVGDVDHAIVCSRASFDEAEKYVLEHMHRPPFWGFGPVNYTVLCDSEEKMRVFAAPNRSAS